MTKYLDRFIKQREQEDKAKIEWLRGTAKEGFDAASRDDYVALNSEEEIDSFLRRVHEEVAADPAAAQACLRRPI